MFTAGRIAFALVALVALDASAREIKTHHFKTSTAISLSLTEKYSAGDEAAFKKNGKVVLLVHGATWSSKCTFDPAAGYSLMDALAEAGYDVWALDLHGYGKSDKSEQDWTEATAAAEDVDAAVDYIRSLRWVEKVNVLGYQWGTWPVGLFAQAHPKKVNKVVLFGIRHNTVERKGEPREQYRQNTIQTAMLKPDDGDLDQDFARRRANVCAQEDPQSPNGALRDMTRRSPVDPAQITSPTMLIMGDRDADPALTQDREQFFSALAAHDKWFVVLAGLGKFANIERGRARFENALISFLDL